MSKYFIFTIMIFLSTYTGCGDDDGGGGNGNNSGTPKPIREVGVRSFGQVSAGGGTTCALTMGGGVNCWGNGDDGQLGNGSNNGLNFPRDPVQDSNGDPITGIVQISVGGSHVCSVTNLGKVLCWGSSLNGQLGNNANTNSNQAVEVVTSGTDTTPLAGIVEVSSGSVHTCALTEQGGVLCWGNGLVGQLGNGDDNADKNYPVAVMESGDVPLAGIVQISTDGYYTCGLKSGGTVVCWGFGNDGRLGNGDTVSKSYPVTVVASEGSSNPLGDIVQISTGLSHACALTSMGKVKCWGFGGDGRLGNGDTVNKSYPVTVAAPEGSSNPLDDIVQIGTGSNYACARTSTGGVKCWGSGTDGQLGNDNNSHSSHPVTVVAGSGNPFALSGIVEISAGSGYVCSLAFDGEMFCWGSGTEGQLGNNRAGANKSYPVKVVADSSDTPLKVGVWRREYACFSDGTCEFNPDSLLRPVLTGAREGASATPAVKVLGVEAGESVALHLDANCSGESIGTGTVGTGADEITITPTALVAKENRIYAKVGSVCSASGADYTYTSGTERIEGDGEDISTDKTPTLTVNLLSNGDKVSIHKSPDCSDTALASGTAIGASLDVTLSDLGSIGSYTLYLKQGDVCHPRGLGYKLRYIGESSRVAGGDDYACAVTNAGGVKCWGEGSVGRLGNGATADTDAPDDVDVVDGDNDNTTDLTGIVQVSTGTGHACALTSGGSVVCWGYGDSGQLGNGANSNKEHPVYVKSADGSSANLSGIVQIVAGSGHTCALTSMGSVKCWGENTVGELGIGTAGNNDNAPRDVVTSSTDTNPLTDIVQISSGNGYSCVLTSGGNVKCWGIGSFGRLGNDCSPSCTSEDIPVDVVASDGNSSLLSGIVQISAGSFHACALTSGGEVKCWGRGASGQLGNGATSDVDAPVTVTSAGTTALTGIAGISLGKDHSCALKSVGGVVCWGAGGNGRLGDGTNTERTRPVDVLTSAPSNPALASIAQIGLGNAHTCAVTTAGVVKCWGKGGVGQLGNDATNNGLLPVDVKSADSSATNLDIGTKNRYACGDARCVFIDN